MRQLPEPKAKYLYIKEALLEGIQDGTLVDNGKLPSEDKLAEVFNASRTTVRSALQSLVDDGVVVKKHGIGNFVQPEHHPMSTILSFDKAAHIPLGEKGYTGFKKDVIIKPEIAEILKIAENDEIVVMNKTMQANGCVSAVVTEYVPASKIIEMPDENKIPVSIYEFAEQNCGVKIFKVLTEVQPVSERNNPFGRDNGPCLMLQESFFDKKNNIVAYSELYMNTNIIHPQFLRK